MQLFHVLNRSVENRTLFEDGHDYARFVHNLYTFNDTTPTDTNNGHWLRARGNENTDVGRPYFRGKEEVREQLVDLHGWCLMKDHYHLLVSERIENGLPLFLKKLNGGYAKYFNERYSRSGALFRGKTKRVPILTDAQHNYILHYIHLNPLDYLSGAENWRLRSKGTIPSAAEALAHLEKYRWSSYLDYAGVRNFPSLITKQQFETNAGGHKKDLEAYLRDTEDLLEEDARVFTLE